MVWSWQPLSRKPANKGYPMVSPDLLSQFAVRNHEGYYNTAGAALMPVVVKNAMTEFMEDTCEDLLGAFGKYSPCRERLRGNLATLMHASSPDEVAITHHTAEGTSIIANGIDWRPGDCIMTLDREYPSTVYPWMNLERRRGVRLIMLEEHEGRVSEAEIVDALRLHHPRLFAISAVEWCSGYRFNLEVIGKACRDLGIFFFVDSAQALGFCDVDVKACHISAMAGSAWKWLFGPFGQGYLYLRRHLLDTITPLFVGSESVPDSSDYSHYHFTLKPDARRFEYSSADMSALVWFDAAVRFVMSLPAEEIRSHVFALQDYALRELKKIGCEVRGDEPRERRSGIMAFRHRIFRSSDLATRLHREAGIFARERDGFVRLAFHLYNSEAGVDRLVSCLKSF